MLELLIVEDDHRLSQALRQGLDAEGTIRVAHTCANGEEALAYCLRQPPDVILMDVRLETEMNGIETVIAIRREFPRMPAVFYSIQDDDVYYRDFLRSGILSHYAYVRKSNFLLPQMIVPLLQDAASGRSFIDPEIESRVQEVRHKDDNAPMALLEPNEQAVALLLAKGMTNEQIAEHLGFRDKRTISRTNGQIYTAWGLNETTTDEKIARARAVLILQEGRLITWTHDGSAYIMDESGRFHPWLPDIWTPDMEKGTSN